MNSNLEKQIDELEFFQSMYSAPGEFKIEDQSSYQQAVAYMQQLTPEAPKTLSSSLHIPVNAHQDSDDEGEGTRESAENATLQYFVDISIRMPNRYCFMHICTSACPQAMIGRTILAYQPLLLLM